MHKSGVFTFGFLISSLVMLAVTPFLNPQNSFSNTAMAQGYDNYGDSYSKYPTEENKYECQKGPLEGFFVSSVEFCKIKFDDTDRKDHSRDNNNQTGTQGPQGSQGETGSQGPPGPVGATGSQGPQGDTGATGPPGPAGNIPGPAGPAGPQGSPGAASTVQGPQGERGFNGTQGPPGPPANASNAYVTWVDSTPGNNDIFFRASQSFGTPINLSNNVGDSNNPQIAATGNSVYVTWQDRTPGRDDIFFAVSNNNGQTFSTTLNLSNNVGSSSNPQIAATGNNVYVTWIDDTPGNGDIFFSASSDNGQTFSIPINLSNNTGFSILPQIATSGNNVYVTWYDGTPGNSDIFFSESSDNGQTFSSPINLSNNTGTSQAPQIAASGNNVYVTWEDNTPGNQDTFFSASSDNGQTFSTPINLSNNTGISLAPQISASENNVYVIWDDVTLGNADIFFSASSDNGQTFSSPINLSNNAGISSEMQISAIGNNVYVTWIDNTNILGGFDIYFFRNGWEIGGSECFDNDFRFSSNMTICCSFFINRVTKFQTNFNGFRAHVEKLIDKFSYLTVG